MSLDKIKIQQKIKDIVSHFDEQAEIDVVEVGDGYSLNIQSELSGILIGKRGETLEALQHILRLILASESEGFVPIEVDVSGYRKLRRIELEEMALRLANQVSTSGLQGSLPPMNSYERRLVHLVLKNFDDLVGESAGQEPWRYIVIKKISNS